MGTNATRYDKARKSYFEVKEMRDRLLAAPAYIKREPAYRVELDRLNNRLKEAEKEMCIYF